MLEQTEISLSPVFLQKSAGSPADLSSLFAQELSNHDKSLHDLLSGYHFMERKRVFDIRIDQDSFTIDENGSGTFRLSYMLGLFNACADLDHTDQAKMTIRIDADFTGKKAVLTGEYFPEREPDDL